MSWKIFPFVASIGIFANPCHLSARELNFIKPSPKPPVIVDVNDDQRYDVHDKFIVKFGENKVRRGSLNSLFPRVNEPMTPNQRPGLVQELVESQKETQRQARTKPKLTVVVGSEPESEGFVDEVESENPAKTSAASIHHHHHRKHHATHNHHAHRHNNRHQRVTKKRRYGRTVTLRSR